MARLVQIVKRDFGETGPHPHGLAFKAGITDPLPADDPRIAALLRDEMPGTYHIVEAAATALPEPEPIPTEEDDE